MRSPVPLVPASLAPRLPLQQQTGAARTSENLVRANFEELPFRALR